MGDRGNTGKKWSEFQLKYRAWVLEERRDETKATIFGSVVFFL